jgi:hypothetical protein
MYSVYAFWLKFTQVSTKRFEVEVLKWTGEFTPKLRYEPVTPGKYRAVFPVGAVVVVVTVPWINGVRL